MQRDLKFNPFLFSRSNIDLKDKWQNMSVSAAGLSPWEKSLTPKPKASSDVSMEPIGDDSARNSAPKYNLLIFEALSVLKDPTGSDVSAILIYDEQKRLEVAQNFRRLLSSKLRRPKIASR